MGFYYVSIFSIVPLGIAYGLLALIYWGVIRASRGTPARKTILSVVGAVFLVLPVGEELWIAWNFGQACTDAGTFIHKKVEVEGFYDDTMRGMTRLVGRPAYRFVESPDDGGKVRRIEHASEAEKARALAWWMEKNPGNKPGANDWITQAVDDRVQVTVEMNTNFAWRITKLDRPTARYHFSVDSGVQTAHKVGKQSSTVIDSQTGELLGQYTRYHREAPWFFISLGSPNQGCDGPDSGPHSTRSFLIYRDVLTPTAKR